jgi:hypothetical protein
MKKIFTVILLAASLVVFAQDTIAVRTTYKDGAQNEIYFTNADGIRIGSYTRYTRYGKVYVKGQYNNGDPIGIWNYYSADTAGFLVQTLDFDKHKETFVDSVHVPSLVCGPRYFGGNTGKQEYIQLHIKTDFTDQEKTMMKGKSVMVVFEVDEKSYTTFAVTVEDNALPLDIRNKIQKIVADMPAWLPPVCDKGDQAVWRQSVVFVF